MREYGLPNPTAVHGSPTWTIAQNAPPCPNCGAQLAEVTVTVSMPMLRGGKGRGVYLGCPACPFASPMATVAVPDEEKETDSEK